MSKEFYNNQSDLTAAKIEIYRKYITGYLPKILLTFQRCLVADLFCGAGKNGDEDGSPLVLIQQIKYLLENQTLKIKNPKIDILFNDKEEKNINNLATSLKDFSHKNIEIAPLGQKDFHTILADILQKNKNVRIPKFFILDPFTYSDVTINNLKSLMALDNTEIFLFIPVFHSYRFANMNFSEGHKTKVFIDEFTTKKITNYDNIDDFMQSIKQKLKQQLNLKYVRPILLEDGKCKNAIFLLTKNREGMLLMNKIALNQSDDGKGINVKQRKSGQASLFGIKETLKFKTFVENLKQELKNNRKMTNRNIVDFTIIEEFLPKHAKDALQLIADQNKIIVQEDGNDITKKQSKWNIAERITKNIIFTYDN